MKEVKVPKVYSKWDTDDNMNIAMMWVARKLDTKHIVSLTGQETGNALARLSIGLRRAVDQGKLVVPPKQTK